jgi:NAD-dependent deacetylase
MRFQRMSELNEARSLVARSRRPVILSGAGLSAESGVPVFRGAGGLWEGFRPEELATPEAFRTDPERVWRWYAWRRDKVDRAQLHAGHRALVAWQERCSDLRIVTQNVDGLHQRAGSTGVLELHGSLIRARCSRCEASREDWRACEDFPPICGCGALLRPAVVWFGEMLPPGAMETATAWIAQGDLLVVVGTSAVVAPASLLPGVAEEQGIPVLEVNPQRTPLSPTATVRLEGPAGEMLPKLVAS